MFFRNTLVTLALLLLLLVHPPKAWGLDEPTNTLPQLLNKIDWDKFKTLPIQYNGRIKPLDSYARVTLLQISGKRSIATKMGKLSAIQWLVMVLCNHPAVQEQPLFLVENPEILQALGMKYDKPRARYSYKAISAHGAKLIEEGNKTEEIRQFIEKVKNAPTRKLSDLNPEMAKFFRDQGYKVIPTKLHRFHKQLNNLFRNYLLFRSLITTLVFSESGPQLDSPIMIKALGKKPAVIDYYKNYDRIKQHRIKLRMILGQYDKMRVSNFWEQFKYSKKELELMDEYRQTESLFNEIHHHIHSFEQIYLNIHNREAITIFPAPQVDSARIEIPQIKESEKLVSQFQRPTVP